MFRTLIYPSSGACECVDELPHQLPYRSSCSQCVVLQPAKRTPPNTSRNKSAHTQRTENKTTDVVIHQHSRRLLKMDILMSETCWAHNKWNKIENDIKLVFHSSTIVTTIVYALSPAMNKSLQAALVKICTSGGGPLFHGSYYGVVARKMLPSQSIFHRPEQMEVRRRQIRTIRWVW